MVLRSEVFGLLLKLIVIVSYVKSQSDVLEVDITCTKTEYHRMDYIFETTTCYDETSSLSVKNSNTKVRNVVNRYGHIMFTQYTYPKISRLYIKDAKDLIYLPNGIKDTFPALKALEVHDSGLTYLDKQKMKQFGDDLQWILFQNCKLTALEGDLFDHNPNLIYIDFERNPLTYIGAQLFENFKQMPFVKEIDFRHCHCVHTFYKKSVYLFDNLSLETFNWNAGACSERIATIDESTSTQSGQKVSDSDNVSEVTERFVKTETERAESYDQEFSEVRERLTELSQMVEKMKDTFVTNSTLYEVNSRTQEKFNQLKKMNEDLSETVKNLSKNSKRNSEKSEQQLLQLNSLISTLQQTSDELMRNFTSYHAASSSSDEVVKSSESSKSNKTINLYVFVSLIGVVVVIVMFYLMHTKRSKGLVQLRYVNESHNPIFNIGDREL